MEVRRFNNGRPDESQNRIIPNYRVQSIEFRLVGLTED